MTEQHIIPADQILPNKLFIIPLNGRPIFPGIFTPLMISGKEDIDVVNKAMESNGLIGLTLMKDTDTENPGSGDLFNIGTVAK